MQLALQEIAGMIGVPGPEGKELHDTLAQGYSIDSRTIREGELFFAVRGETRDGHEFLEAAFGKGAVAAVASRGLSRHGGRLLLVADPKRALQQLASRARERWRGRMIAITGSNGKTTTKEITAALLATRFRMAKSEGNLNNDLGLPLSLLRMDDAAEVGVVELGMNHAGEIRALARIARPDVGVVTNVNPVHLEFFPSMDEIAAAKRELIESLPEQGVAVLNADDERVREFGRSFGGRVVTFAVKATADVRAVEVEERGAEGTRFRLETGPEQFTTPLGGRHNLYNTIAGLAVAQALGIAPGSLVEEVRELTPVRMRGEMMEVGGIRVINDCYNSNPRAAEAMLDLLAATSGLRRVAVLGEMLELGRAAEEWHRQVGRRAAKAGIDLLVGVSGQAEHLVDEARRKGLPESVALFYRDAREAGQFLKNSLRPGDVVLFKGSRGVRLEEALEAVTLGSRHAGSHHAGSHQPSAFSHQQPAQSSVNAEVEG